VRARFTAESDGTSLVVLPVGYSKCVEMRGVSRAPDTRAQMLRADGALVGILFSGSVDVILQQNVGPFSNSTGRFADYCDFKSFLKGN
jgi:hypothetical protein